MDNTCIVPLSDDDTDEEGELSDHDLTPCNASPNHSQLLHLGGADGSHMRGAAGRFLDQDEVEDVWKRHVHVLTQNASNEILLDTFLIFGELFNVSLPDRSVYINKTCTKNYFCRSYALRPASCLRMPYTP